MFFSLSIHDDYAAMSRAAAGYALEFVRAKPDALICVATGASPEGMYAAMAEQAPLLAQARMMKLDEWGGVDRDDPSTCETFIRRHIMEPWGIPDTPLHGFNPEAEDPAVDCRRMAAAIEAMGGIDLCILGMGADGHIGLNYPAPALPASAHVTGPETLQHSMLQSARRRPTHGMTLGMAEVLSAREIVLVVSGRAKAGAVARMLSGNLTTELPASLLVLHSGVRCFLDKDAAMLVNPPTLCG